MPGATLRLEAHSCAYSRDTRLGMAIQWLGLCRQPRWPGTKPRQPAHFNRQRGIPFRIPSAF